ncbi:hypothetical protein [Shewanella maritima]|uniref:hypothetical protein n=1 Tax=Shewanella maritima TaxID=2520507 RepID=UPI0037365A6F
MDKTAYLDAMNITRWRSADKPGKPYMVLHDLDADMHEHDFINRVLCLMGVDPQQCDFDCTLVSGPQVVWDMRKVKMRPRVAWVVTSPLVDILQSAESKRDLWQQIVSYKNTQASDD